jgi:hypothetical protein
MSNAIVQKITAARARLPHMLMGVLVFCAAGQVAAQQQPDTVTISGTVRDAMSGEPISYAIISLDGVATVMAESDGTFALPHVLPGTRTLEIRRLGYAARRLVLTVRAGMPLHVSVTLDALASELAPVDVQAVEPIRRDLTGFLERRERGFGHHVTRSEFVRWNPTTATDVLRRIPGVRVRPNPEYGWGGDSGIPDRRRYVVETSRGGAITYNPLAGPECPVMYFVDGIMVGNARDSDIDSFLAIHQVEAIESYVGVQVPVTFQHPAARCGVVAFWTGPQDTTSDSNSSALAGIAGAAAGVALGLAAPSNCSTCLFDTGRVQRTIGNAIVLGVLGVVIGRFVHGSGTSQSSVARGVGITVLPGGDRIVGVAATISFGTNPLHHRSPQQNPR